MPREHFRHSGAHLRHTFYRHRQIDSRNPLIFLLLHTGTMHAPTMSIAAIGRHKTTEGNMNTTATISLNFVWKMRLTLWEKGERLKAEGVSILARPEGRALLHYCTRA